MMALLAIVPGYRLRPRKMVSSDDHALPFDACLVEGGCHYLHELARIENLIGCQPTAKFCQTMAARCIREGCWAMLLHLEKVTRPPCGPPRFRPRASRPARGSPAFAAKRRTADVIPLVRGDVADVVSDGEGNFVERRGLRPSSLEATEPLGYLFDYWRWLHSMTHCELSNIDTVHLMRSGVIGRLHVVNVDSPNPNDFHFEMFGYAVPLEPQQKPGLYSTAIYADTVMRDYNTVRLTAAPRLQRVRARLGLVFHHYVRLILPLFNERRGVSRLLVAIRQEELKSVRLSPP